ncbi:MAG: single-stranded DNA-binding protein [Christensenellaceae bacterium]|nr:single-stranded DNA-binding protein [Christensenellaceae bacterium]DAS00360.1 MAG TPA: Single strand binding protein [Bacteriophage sp.]
MNKIMLTGNLTAEPDMRQTASGIAVCTFTLAVNRRTSKEDGEKKTDFIPVITWRGLAENCFKYLRKGRKAAVSGSLQIRNYEAQDGSRRYIAEVIAEEVEFLSPAETALQTERISELPMEPITPRDELPF